MDKKHLLSLENKFKKQLQKQILINSAYLVGAILLFFTFISNTFLALLKTYNWIDINIFTNWQLLIPNLVDLSYLIVLAIICRKVIKDTHEAFLQLNDSMSEKEIHDNIVNYLEKNNYITSNDILKKGIFNAEEVVKNQDITLSAKLIALLLGYNLFEFGWFILTEKISLLNQASVHIGFLSIISLLIMSVTLLVYMPVRQIIIQYQEELFNNLDINLTNETLKKKLDKNIKQMKSIVKIENIIVLSTLFVLLFVLGMIKNNNALIYSRPQIYNSGSSVLEKINEHPNFIFINLKLSNVETEALNMNVSKIFNSNIKTISCEEISTPTDLYNLKQTLNNISFSKKNDNELLKFKTFYIDEKGSIYSSTYKDEWTPVENEVFINLELKENIASKIEIINNCQ